MGKTYKGKSEFLKTKKSKGKINKYKAELKEVSYVNKMGGNTYNKEAAEDYGGENFEKFDRKR